MFDVFVDYVDVFDDNVAVVVFVVDVVVVDDVAFDFVSVFDDVVVFFILFLLLLL